MQRGVGMLLVLLLVLFRSPAPLYAGTDYQNDQEPCEYGGAYDEPDGFYYSIGILVQPGCIVGRHVEFQIRGHISSGPAQVQVTFLGITSEWIYVNNATYTTVNFDMLPAKGGERFFDTKMRRAPGAPEYFVGGGQLTQDTTPPESHFNPLRDYSGGNQTLHWAASDGLGYTNFRYDVDARVGQSGPWQSLYRNTTATEGSYSGKNGQHVYFRVRATDDFGNTEPWTATYDEDVIFDTLGPTAIVDISFVGSGSVQALVSADDNLSGVAEMRVGRRDTIASAPWVPFQSSITVSRSGAPTGCVEVAVQIRDVVRNASKIMYTPVPGTGCAATNPNTVYLPMVRR